MSLTDQVISFNAKYKVGDKVKFKMDDGSIKELTIAHQARVAFNYSVIVWFKEISGHYSINRVIN